MKQGNCNSLRYVKHESLDKARWDLVVEQSSNFRVYALTWFLDRVSEGWDALIWGDYEFVMPMTIRRKWGIKYLFPPMFCQQLGIFPVPPIQIQIEFFNRIREIFLFIEIQVNSQMDPGGFPGLTVFTKDNFVLPLFESYAEISSKYSKDRTRNLKVAKKSGITVLPGMNAREYIKHKCMALSTKITKSSFGGLEAIISYTQSVGKGFILNAYTRNNELCAAAFFVRSGNRVVYLNAFSTQEGRATSAMTAILDQLICAQAGSGLLLDFEGSTIPGIARFMKGFGAQCDTYYQLSCNHLPLPLKWLKR
jgi:hypothetical protein